MKMNLPLSLIAAAGAVLISGTAMADVAKGAKVFKRKCASCHSFEANGTGPNLKGVIGRKAGSTDFPRYKGLKGADFVWDEASIDGWLTNPKKFIGKPSSMAVKIKKAKDRAALIAFMKSKAE